MPCSTSRLGCVVVAKRQQYKQVSDNEVFKDQDLQISTREQKFASAISCIRSGHPHCREYQLCDSEYSKKSRKIKYSFAQGQTWPPEPGSATNRSYLVVVPSYDMSCALIFLTGFCGWDFLADIDINPSLMGPIFGVLIGPTLGVPKWTLRHWAAAIW